ncbi:MAG TPA: protein kinase [Thermoanaerobaculia bacterium]|nr:protein kinase [Thermoanaerobaculia bacterium]
MSGSLQDLFARARELPADERAKLLDGLRAEDAPLADRLDRLLAAAEREVSPLDRTPWHGWESDEHDDEPADDLPLPERIGAYRVLRELGRGGMGRVFLAEEETPDFRRTVALKVIDRPGHDGDTVRRFRDEVRILASLQHSGIARFLDGGRAADGTWFLALEHVEGDDLIAHVRSRGLGVRERVELFAAALDAVQHAHARGIVHRDLKPSNLLVGGDGRPRLLDFGISKLVDPEAQDGGEITRTQARVLTPAYASPEQFRGEPVTPASDVFSLGVLLYELLADRRPFAAAAGSAALAQAVLESDPVPPSSAWRRPASRDAGGVAIEGIAPAEARPRRLDRDLDAICLRALRKEPAARYPDAGAFAADLRRYLAGRPVEARQGGRRYRAARLLQRHRGKLAVAAALLVAAAALTISAIAYRRAELARASAKVAAQQSARDRVPSAARNTTDPEAYRLYLRGRYLSNERTAAALGKAIQYFGEAIARDPRYAVAYAGLADVHSTLASAYNKRVAPLAAREPAKAAATHAVETGPNVSEAHAALGQVLMQFDWDWAGAERELDRAVALDPANTAALHARSHLFLALGRFDDSAADSSRALDVDPASVMLGIHLGEHYHLSRRLDAAAEQYGKALELNPDHPNARPLLAMTHEQQGDYAAAIADLERAAPIFAGTSRVRGPLGRLYARAGRIREARALLAELQHERAAGSYIAADDIAAIYVGLGETDLAFDWLRRACDERAAGLVNLAVEPAYDPLRGDLRFAALLRCVGLPDLRAELATLR